MVSKVAVCVFALSWAAGVLSLDETCPSGGELYTYGSSEEDIKSSIAEQNKYRQMALDGQIPNQPAAEEMPMLTYDEDLAYGAQMVVLSCEMKHNITQPANFPSAGQNLFIAWSSEKDCKQDWARAVKSWYDENSEFEYPNTNDNTLHYSQLVWADTTAVGCDFSCFYDTNPKMAPYPYATLYACNYGPAGNVQGEAPYKAVE